MKSNSTVIGVVVCIVCCFCALCIIPHITTSDNDLAGWNPSSMYDGVISPDNSNFTEAVLEENNAGGMAAAPHVSSTGSRMFHHGGASTMSMPAGAATSSYAGASVHTTSSAAMSGTGSSISPISTSTATGSMSGSSMGGGAIYATSNSVSPRSGSASGSSLISSSALSAPTASRAAAPMMSASSAATSGNPSAMYASNMSSNYGNASYGGYSGPKGVRGAMKAPPTIPDNDYSGFFEWLIDLEAYLYRDDDGGYYFDYNKVYEWYSSYIENSGGVPPSPDDFWNDFKDWVENSDVYHFPIPDGVGVLLVLSLLCVLFTYLRSRDKKILEESNNQ